MACAAGTLVLTKQTLVFIPTAPEDGEGDDGGADKAAPSSSIPHSASHSHAWAVERKRKEYRDGLIKPVGNVEIALATITAVESRRYQLQVRGGRFGRVEDFCEGGGRERYEVKCC
jgi:hypothetical protein